MNFSKLFIGKALKTEELKGEKLNAFGVFLSWQVMLSHQLLMQAQLFY